MRDYKCDLCGGHIDLIDDDGEELNPISIRIGTVETDLFASWNVFYACEECSEKLLALISSMPYKDPVADAHN